MTTDNPKASDIFRRFLTAVAEDDIEARAALYAENMVVEMPFGPPLYPRIMHETPESVRARGGQLRSLRRFEKIDNIIVHETANPEIVVGEYEAHWTILATGETLVMPYIMVMTIKAGKIVHSRDYGNPLLGARAMGRLPELLKALDIAPAEAGGRPA